MRVLKNERLEKEVLLTISKNDLLRDVHSELLAQSHQVKKHGFRSGKIPTKILFQERGPQALDAVVHKAVLAAFSEIVGDKKLATPLGYAIETNLDGVSMENLPDVDVRVNAVFEPEIGDISWKDIALDHYVAQPSDEDVDANLRDLAQQVMTSVPLSEKRPAAIGDTLVYTMTYTHQDGSVKEVEGSFQLGSNALPKEFETTLEGITEGHVMSESLRVPKDFADKTLAGKKVKFNITFHEIRQTVPHQVNEDFAKSRGFDSLEAMREDARKSLSQSAGIMSEMVMRKALREKLGHVHAFDVPESWVEKALESLKHAHAAKNTRADQVNDAATQDSLGSTPPASAATDEDLKSKALALVRGDFVIRKVINENHFSVRDSEILAYAQAMARSEGRSLDSVIESFSRNKAFVNRISNEIQERKALDWVANQCAKQDKEIPLAQLRQAFAEATV